MNSYLLRRLFPFYILAVAAEFIFTVYSMAAADSPLDMSFFWHCQDIRHSAADDDVGFSGDDDSLCGLSYAFAAKLAERQT